MDDVRAHRDLVERARRGDHAAFAALVKHCQRAVFAAAMKILRNKDEAEDVVAQTMAKSFTHLESFGEVRDGAGFCHWMNRIGRNLAIDLVRRARTRRTSPLDDHYEPRADEAYSPDARLHDAAAHAEHQAWEAELHRTVHGALEEMPGIHRDVLRMADFENKQYREIAQLLGIPIGTVMSRLNAARRKLADKMMTAAGRPEASAAFAELVQAGPQPMRARSRPAQ